MAGALKGVSGDVFLTVLTSLYVSIANNPAKAAKGEGLLELRRFIVALLPVSKINQVPLQACVHVALSRGGHDTAAAERIAGTLRTAVSHARRIQRQPLKAAQACRYMKAEERSELEGMLGISSPTTTQATTSILHRFFKKAPTSACPKPEQTQRLETPEKTQKLEQQSPCMDPFSPSWRPESWATAASCFGGQRLMTESPKAQGEARSPSTGDKQSLVCAVTAPAPAKASPSPVAKPVKGKGKGKPSRTMMSEKIGRITVSLGEKKSELCFYSREAPLVRRHLTTVEAVACHRSIAVALVRLACSTPIELHELRAVKVRKTEELRQISAT